MRRFPSLLLTSLTILAIGAPATAQDAANPPMGSSTSSGESKSKTKYETLIEGKTKVSGLWTL